MQLEAIADRVLALVVFDDKTIFYDFIEQCILFDNPAHNEPLVTVHAPDVNLDFCRCVKTHQVDRLRLVH